MGHVIAQARPALMQQELSMVDHESGPAPARVGIPEPPHPSQRREPLPGHRPKPAEDDPGAPERLRAILESATYREADQDVDFLSLDATRGVRLQIDYVKPELLLSQHAIAHTIVVFGSTRIVEPSAARSRRCAWP
jgi:hypothetical protein